MTDSTPLLLRAISYAAKAHRSQLRKDGVTPYVSHVARVMTIVRQIFHIDDEHVLAAAMLHDVIEDTTTDFDDLAREFDPTIAAWVSALSKDKRLAEESRETAYEATLAGSSWQVAVVKLADVFDNLHDSVHLSAEARRKTLIRARRYLDALKPRLPHEVQTAYIIVNGLLNRLEHSGQ